MNVVDNKSSGFVGERSIVLPQETISELEKHPVSSVLFITDIGYYPVAKQHYRNRIEPIQEYVFIYCVEGNGWFEIEGKRHKVERDNYFILPAGISHSYGSSEDNPWSIYWIHFRGKLASHYAKGQAVPTPIKPGVYSRIQGRISLFEEIFNLLRPAQNRDNLYYSTCVFFNFLGSLKYLPSYRSLVGNNTGEQSITAAAIHYMNENIERHITLEDIADHVGYSTSYFSSVFTKEQGCSPVKYLNKIRVDEACKLLEDPTMQINQICFKIGITDSFYFSRMFKKAMGVSPMQYRDKIRNRQSV
ncbi:MAG TPA: AraC family transcriptional regulator [Porphyromonadaceae bacterium]|nr:AraC family transcriptional regulator [Porphyromonadaceae bacterium]